MDDDKRLEQVHLRFRKAVLDAAKADAARKGQPLTTWFERLVEASMPQETQDAENAR
jgi:hypothetical protein